MGSEAGPQCVGLGDSWEVQAQGSATACPCPRPPDVSYEVICNGCHLCWAGRCLEGAKARVEAAAANAQLGGAYQEVWVMPRTQAACSEFVNL